MANVITVLPQLLLAMLHVIGGFAALPLAVKSRRAALTSSAVFLLVFFVVHGLGNLTALVSGDTFNKYGHKLHSLGLLLYVVEAYLFIGFLVHSSSALLITRSDKKVQLGSRFSWTQARLAVSGVIVLAFVVLHVLTFRFGKWYTATVDGVEVRDLWRLQKEVFSSLPVVVFYEVSVMALCSHLLWGWTKAVKKPTGLGAHLPKEAQPAAEAIGNLLAYAVTLAYMAVPIYTYLVVHGRL